MLGIQSAWPLHEHLFLKSKMEKVDRCLPTVIQCLKYCRIQSRTDYINDVHRGPNMNLIEIIQCSIQILGCMNVYQVSIK